MGRLQLGLRPLQRGLYDDMGRFNVWVCHRRFGKTVLCISVLIKRAFECKLINPRFAYIAPQYKQAKRAAWDYLKLATDGIPGRKVYEQELRVDLPGGRRISLYGAEDVDALRGIYLDGVVLDEYAQMASRLWGEVIRPALSDRKGWAIFIGTPRGRNEFCERYEYACLDSNDWVGKLYRSSETGIVDDEELSDARATMTEEEFDQEYECSFTAAIKGAYYGRLLADADRDGRVCGVPYDPAIPVHTCWDLGFTDATAIWFFQRAGKELHWVDYYEASGEALSHYAQILLDRRLPASQGGRGYVYGEHILPHDGRAKNVQTGETPQEALRKLGIDTEICRLHQVQDGIQKSRLVIPMSWFDAERCKQGLEALRQYQRVWDDSRKDYGANPLHDWASHGSDAFRTGAMFVPTASNWGRKIVYKSSGAYV